MGGNQARWRCQPSRLSFFFFSIWDSICSELCSIVWLCILRKFSNDDNGNKDTNYTSYFYFSRYQKFQAPKPEKKNFQAELILNILIEKNTGCDVEMKDSLEVLKKEREQMSRKLKKAKVRV